MRKREAAKAQAAKPPASKKKGLWDRTVDSVKEDWHDAGDFVKRNADVISEVGHTALDVAGMVPVIGAVADGVNAGWYAAAGDYTNAGLSLAGMVPGVGDAAIAGKLAMKGAKLAAKAGKTIDVGKKVLNTGARAYEGYGMVQDAEGVIDGTADAINQFSHGDYLHGGLSVVNAGLSAFGVHGGAKGAAGGGGHHDPLSGGDRTSPASDPVSAPAKGSNQVANNSGTTGARRTRDPLAPRVVKTAGEGKNSTSKTGSGHTPGRSHSPVVGGGRNDKQTHVPAAHLSRGRDSIAQNTLGGASPASQTSHSHALRQIGSSDTPGLRQYPYTKLNDEEIARLRKELGQVRTRNPNDPSKQTKVIFNEGEQTGYLGKTDTIYIRGDINPSPNPSIDHPRSRMSSRATLAHELGHAKHRETHIPQGEWRDEFRASYYAALHAPGLSNEERKTLLHDAITRVRELDEQNKRGIVTKHGLKMTLKKKDKNGNSEDKNDKPMTVEVNLERLLAGLERNVHLRTKVPEAFPKRESAFGPVED